jgi:predicted small metal-binding protein
MFDMPKVLRCKHIGPDRDCQFAARGDTEEQILDQVARHARDQHGIQEVPQELVDRALANIQEEPG